MSNRDRDAQEAEFLLGNALLSRVLAEMEKDATERAMNAYSARDEQQANYAMHEALAARDLMHRLHKLLKQKQAKVSSIA